MIKGYLTLIFIVLNSLAYAQLSVGDLSYKKPLLDLRIRKTGPYFGLQQGKYLVPEIGIEKQWKRVKLKRPLTHAAHTGFNYNIKYKVLGYDVGYWIKTHRIGLTYGANVFYRTNFTTDRFGVAPVIGYKFWLLHLQTGYQIFTKRKSFDASTIFISLRLGIINERDVELKRRKKK